MNLFTITTKHPEWDELTAECVDRVKRYSGHDLEVVQAKDQWDAHVLKLTHPLKYAGHVWFVDSDWWPVKEFIFPEILEGGITAPYCRSGHERYITTCADTKKVFGTTIIGMDLTGWKLRHCLRSARAMQAASFWDGKPRMDEFFLNLAVLSQGEVPVRLLDGEWIYNGKRSPEAIAVHAGARWPKLEWLRDAVL